MKSSLYKQVIFDLGGVLFYWNPKEVSRLLKEKDPDFPLHIEKIIYTQTWTDLDAGILSLEEAVQQLSTCYPRQYIERFVSLSLEKLVPLEKGISLLKQVQAQKKQTFILSNISGEFFKKISLYKSLLDSFDGAVFSYEIHTVKPHKKIYQFLLDKYFLKPEECLFIDDSLANVATAQKMGIDAIVCQEHQHVHDELLRLKII
ncbi:HAD family phosphatase [Neochlamydia sp. EPS4]|uniref:HAD family hydrolase n=1 Tax=Neochlamydia sp. EPS4 TaxID=1478175 RepID=UPI0005D10964|nr:HAD family phosphatase [Neochlamydia sp. EPS4]